MNNEEKKLKVLLEKMIKSSEDIFIVGHNNPDFDAIASSIAIEELARALGKRAYIIVDDVDLESGVKKIVTSCRLKYNIITREEFLYLNKKNPLLIMTDVNKDYLISLKEDLELFDKILIVDHHKEDEDTVKTKYKYINTQTSSTSELLTNVLISYRQSIITEELANFLLAGIVLDTKRYRLNTTVDTLNAAKQLVKRGAKNEVVEDLFFSEFEEDRRVSNLIYSNTLFRSFQSGIINKNISFTLDRTHPTTIYKREELAKASDKLLKYKVDASFALGYISEDEISISARSKSDIDVADILSSLPNAKGGGSKTAAGAKIPSKVIDLESLEKSLIETTTEYLENIHDNPYVLKNTKKY